jgi:hypothetical protein
MAWMIAIMVLVLIVLAVRAKRVEDLGLRRQVRPRQRRRIDHGRVG